MGKRVWWASCMVIMRKPGLKSRRWGTLPSSDRLKQVGNWIQRNVLAFLALLCSMLPCC